MLLFTLLLIMLIALAIVTVSLIAAVGTVGIVIFGDVIVCIVFIALLMKYVIKRRNKKKGTK